MHCRKYGLAALRQMHIKQMLLGRTTEQRKILLDCAPKWINRRQQVLEYWLDNSSSILSLTQTMVTLHSLSEGFTMVTANGEDTGRGFFRLINNCDFIIVLCLYKTTEKKG